jgi:hypothetical protein
MKQRTHSWRKVPMKLSATSAQQGTTSLSFSRLIARHNLPENLPEDLPQISRENRDR